MDTPNDPTIPASSPIGRACLEGWHYIEDGGVPDRVEPCQQCSAAPGWAIAPHDIRHLLDGPLGTPAPTPEQSAILLGAHVASRERGGRGIVDVANPWHLRTDTGMRYRAERISITSKNVLAKVECGYFFDGWEVLLQPGYKGDELRVNGQVHADARLLTCGVALLGTDGSVRVPS